MKIIKVRPAEGSPGGAAFMGRLTFPFGKAETTADGEFVLHVPSEQSVAVSQQILAAGPIADITIEDVPLEDIIAELFGRQT
jgi:ABC-2 type transport system ATP-binding protein